MANKGLSMRKVREVLRLHYAAGLSTRAIARSLKVSPATVGKYIRRAEEQGLSWPLPEPLDDAALERRLFPAPVLSAQGSVDPPHDGELSRDVGKGGVEVLGRGIVEEHVGPVRVVGLARAGA